MLKWNKQLRTRKGENPGFFLLLENSLQWQPWTQPWLLHGSVGGGGHLKASSFKSPLRPPRCCVWSPADIKTSQKRTYCLSLSAGFGNYEPFFFPFLALLACQGGKAMRLPPFVQGKARAQLSAGDTGLSSGRLLGCLQLLTERNRRWSAIPQMSEHQADWLHHMTLVTFIKHINTMPVLLQLTDFKLTLAKVIR